MDINDPLMTGLEGFGASLKITAFLTWCLDLPAIRDSLVNLLPIYPHTAKLPHTYTSVDSDWR